MGIMISTMIGLPMLAGVGVWSSLIAAMSDMSLCKEAKWLQISAAVLSFVMIPIAWTTGAMVPVLGSFVAASLIIATLFGDGLLASFAASKTGECKTKGQSIWMATTCFILMLLLGFIVLILG